jgi:ABC-type transport system substrate-binding protein
MADPGSASYWPAWAGLMSEVKVQSVRRVRAKLRHPHVLPQGWLQVQLTSSGPLGARYRVAEQADGETRFEPARPPAAGTEPSPVIVERFYAEPRKAIEDLRKGKIDAIDRLLPSDALRLRNDESFHVGAYAFPSIHVLVPNRESPFLDNRVFRRALLYGINREVVLKKGLLDGVEVEGMRVLSAPLPAGVTGNDPAAYAYDEAIRPLPYDPVMSAILLRLAEQQLGAAADKKQEKAPELKELVLAHPAGEMPRFICKQIQTQWNVIGVKCVLRELPPGQSKVTDGKYDVLYGELMIREPLTDAARVFGPAGLVATADPFLSLTLRRLDEAANWKDARDTLHELHRLLYEDVTLLPLFQMIDYFVYQTGLTGVQDRPIAFYQNVERWRVVPQVEQE